MAMTIHVLEDQLKVYAIVINILYTPSVVSLKGLFDHSETGQILVELSGRDGFFKGVFRNAWPI
ncbi:hypothetical protein JCM5296_002445, partial [Sporobolomyces johnsonii]